MPHVSVLLKPASSACNMNCKYCFYKDEANCRETAFCYQDKVLSHLDAGTHTIHPHSYFHG